MPSAPFLYEVASHVKKLPFRHYYYQINSFIYRACLAADTSLCCSLVSYETPLNFCMVSLMLARTGMDKIYVYQTLVLGHPLSSCQSVMCLYTSHKHFLGDYVWGQSCPKPVAASHHMVSFHEFPVRIWMSLW